MIDIYSILLNVAAIWLIAVITPGPNFFITVRTAMAKSRKAGFYVVLGICCGAAVWGLAGFWGLTLLFTAAPGLYLGLKIIGGCYLIYLGLRLITASLKKSGARDTQTRIETSKSSAFLTGLITILTNPKTAFFTAGLFAATMPPDPPYWLGHATMGLMCLISLSWYSTVVLVFSSTRASNAYQKARQWIDRLAGASFMAFGAKLMIQE